MFKKFILAIFMLGSTLAINASTDTQVEGLQCDQAQSITLNQNSNTKHIWEMVETKGIFESPTKSMAVTCNQCRVDHQVCLQRFSRPFCRQQLADCRESCQ